MSMIEAILLNLIIVLGTWLYFIQFKRISAASQTCNYISPTDVRVKELD